MTVRTAATAAAVLAALKLSQQGDAVELTQDIGTIALSGIKLVDVTIRPPVGVRRLVAGVELTDCAGLNFANVDFRLNSRLKNTANIVRGKDILFVNSSFADIVGSSNGGVMIRDSSGVALLDSELKDLGTALIIINSTNTAITGNDFHDLRGDAIQGSLSNDGVVIRWNTFTDFYPPVEAHPDCIQFFTLNAAVASKNIVIDGNVYTRGKGKIVQGIFLGNEKNIPYVNVTIINNSLEGAMWNAIFVVGANNVVLKDNYVGGWADQGSWTKLLYCDSVVATNNRTTTLFDVSTCTNVSQSGNVVIPNLPVGGQPPSPPPPPPPPIDPLVLAAALLKIGVLEATVAQDAATIAAQGSQIGALNSTIKAYVAVATDRDEDRALASNALNYVQSSIAELPLVIADLGRAEAAILALLGSNPPAP